MTDEAEVINFEELSSDELVSLRVDYGKMAQVKQNEAGKFKSRIRAITSVLRARQAGGMFEITDHAVLRYLERAKGIDTEAIRAEMRAELLEATSKTKVKGKATGFLVGDHVYVVARGTIVVTVYPARDYEIAKAEKMDALAESQSDDEPTHP